MVKEVKLEIIWSPTAIKELKDAYLYLRKESKSSAKKVRDSIIKQIEKLSIYPAIFELDRLKDNNPGNYRAFEKYNYRIAYKYTETELYILRIRHASREPLEH